MPKFLDDKEALLESNLYSDVFERKGVKFIRMRRSKDFTPLVGIDFEVYDDYVWTKTDSLFKLANRYYGSYDAWWTIGILNGKPTDAHFKIGDLVYIPKNPTQIIERMR